MHTTRAFRRIVLPALAAGIALSAGACGPAKKPHPGAAAAAPGAAFTLEVSVRDTDGNPVDATLSLYRVGANGTEATAAKSASSASGMGFTKEELNPANAGSFWLVMTPPPGYEPLDDTDGSFNDGTARCANLRACIKGSVNALGNIAIANQGGAVGNTADDKGHTSLWFVVRRTPPAPTTTSTSTTTTTSAPAPTYGINVEVVDPRDGLTPVAGGTLTLIAPDGAVVASMTSAGTQASVGRVPAGSYLLVHSPPAGYAVIGNIHGTSPAQTMTVTVGPDKTTVGVAFYDTKVPPTTTQAVTDPSAPRSTTTTSTTPPREELPPPAPPAAPPAVAPAPTTTTVPSEVPGPECDARTGWGCTEIVTTAGPIVITTG